jgi:hypothetical protein
MSETSPFKDPSGLVSARLTALLRVWKDIAGDRIAPSRDEITPARIRGLMASSWMMDVIGDGDDFRFRFAGDRIIQFMGHRYAGTLLSSLRGHPFFDGMQAILSACVRTKQPIALGPIRSSYEGKEFLEMEIVVLPLSDDGARITALFGGFDTWPLGTHMPTGQ